MKLCGEFSKKKKKKLIQLEIGFKVKLEENCQKKGKY